MKVSYWGTVNEAGQLKITNRAKFDSDIQKYFTSKHIEITVQKRRKLRSNMQNAYYWGVVVPIVHQGFIDLGNECSKEDVHEFLKAKFNYKEIVNEKTAEIIQFPQSTASITTSQFMDYIAEIQRFGSEFLSIQIPSPSEKLTLDL